MRECPKGKPCSAACIHKLYACKADFPNPVTTLMGKAKTYVKEEGGHVADHIGKNVAAWKIGKTLGGLVSGYLESRYNIPREISIKLAETAIQGLAATGLDIRNLKSNDELVKKLFTEMAAAFVGKTSHTGVETIVSAKEMSTTLENVLPMLAGKVSGLSTSLISNRLPTPKETLSLLQERSKEDIGKIRNFLEKSALSFAEGSQVKLEEIVGDFVLLTLLSLRGKFKQV